MGSVRIRIFGQVPPDLILYVSENYQNVTESNSTWSFTHPTGVTIFPKDQHILNPKKATDKDKKKFQQLYLKFDTSKDDAQFQVQVTFPEEEYFERKRRQAQEALNEAMGNEAPDLSTLKDKDGMTLDEKEALAEKNFKIIKDRVLARQGKRAETSNKDFVESNIVAHEDKTMGPQQKRQRLERNQQLIKNRHDDAKRRRDLKEKEEIKMKILQYFRWDLIKLRRLESLEKMNEELEVIRLARTWCIKVATRRVLKDIFMKLKKRIENRQINIAKLVIAKRMINNALKRLKKKGATFEDRLRQNIRRTITGSSTFMHDSVSLRAKQYLADFIQKCGQNQSFKYWTFDFLKGIYKINA